MTHVSSLAGDVIGRPAAAVAGGDLNLNPSRMSYVSTAPNVKSTVMTGDFSVHLWSHSGKEKKITGKKKNEKKTWGTANRGRTLPTGAGANRPAASFRPAAARGGVRVYPGGGGDGSVRGRKHARGSVVWQSDGGEENNGLRVGDATRSL